MKNSSTTTNNNRVRDDDASDYYQQQHRNRNRLVLSTLDQLNNFWCRCCCMIDGQLLINNKQATISTIKSHWNMKARTSHSGTFHPSRPYVVSPLLVWLPSTNLHISTQSATCRRSLHRRSSFIPTTINPSLSISLSLPSHPTVPVAN